ncbi:MAG: hypothetical protein Pg6C_20120 [Treponemataceae bacterium]|nr:MAG: hypothetical protein Pg6C_20120 [Treponemataceae bacterium]
MKKAEKYLAREAVTQYWARPHQLKDKPFAERIIDTLQKECPDCNYAPLNVPELSAAAGEWLDKYHNFRPYAAPGMLAPAAYATKLAHPVLPARSVL